MNYPEEIYEVYWQGPYKPRKLSKLSTEECKKLCLYSVYGSHPIYGNNVLLYIGMTLRTVNQRLKEHSYWMDQERFGESRVYLASIGKFENWSESWEIDLFDRPPKDVIEKVEKLLIYAHQTFGNTANKKQANLAAGLRIFNTGSYGSLKPEVSALYEEIEASHN
ncbi:hypothetical protein EOL70_11510 [Leucothrix sargassi]|nr:hypothetical protein EOL70_11510 [Leucothrix sargassi]